MYLRIQYREASNKVIVGKTLAGVYRRQPRLRPKSHPWTTLTEG